MVGLLAERPQRGKSGITNLGRVQQDFEAVFATNCRDIDQGRPTGEKRLQSFLIREAYTHSRRLISINLASNHTDEPVELWFITDEIALPVETGKVVCDLLALRRDNRWSVPVVLELKDARQLKRLIEQVEGYAGLVDQHGGLFCELYAALLGSPVEFQSRAEKWIIWPAAGKDQDPREAELAARGIRVVGYTPHAAGSYEFQVGRGVSSG